MATAPSRKDTRSDAQIKQNIIRHMNADHHDSLVRYLEHAFALPSRTARHAHLTDITLSSLHLATSAYDTYTIPLDPAMSSWAEARPRLVALDHAALAALGRSDVTVKRYVAPRGWHAALMAFCATLLLVFHRRAHLAPGANAAARRWPRVFAVLHAMQPSGLWGLVVAHSGEAWWMDRTRLRVHSVPRFSRVWWAWMAGTFVEGFPNFFRVDALVAEERRKKEAKKH